MKLFALATMIGSLALSVTSAAADGGAGSAGGKSWGYKDNDPSMYGPSEWAAQYPGCAGKRQSPIDLTHKALCGDAGVDVAASPLEFAGTCPDFKLKQTEDVYKGEVQNGTCTVRAKSKAYDMLQFHMHAPSEHTVNGKAYDAEAHFVHKNTDGSALLVVGVFLEKVAGAVTDPWLASVWNTLGAVNSTDAVSVKLAPYAPLLVEVAAKGHVFNYPGSLTTPTCDEIVDWWVLEKPVKVSAADFDKFQAHLEKLPATDRGRGARPVQPLNGRTVDVY